MIPHHLDHRIAHPLSVQALDDVDHPPGGRMSDQNGTPQRCAHRHADGEHCGRWPSPGSRYCYLHRQGDGAHPPHSAGPVGATKTRRGLVRGKRGGGEGARGADAVRRLNVEELKGVGMSKSRSVRRAGVRDQGSGLRGKHGGKGPLRQAPLGCAPFSSAQGKPVRQAPLGCAPFASSRDKRGKQGNREKLLPPIGGTREEVQRTLVETMEGILSGRLEPKEAFAIGRLCKLQLKLLGFMEQLERSMKKEEEVEKARRREVKRSGGQEVRKGGVRWVN